MQHLLTPPTDIQEINNRISLAIKINQKPCGFLNGMNHNLYEKIILTVLFIYLEVSDYWKTSIKGPHVDKQYRCFYFDAIINLIFSLNVLSVILKIYIPLGKPFVLIEALLPDENDGIILYALPVISYINNDGLDIFSGN